MDRGNRPAENFPGERRAMRSLLGRQGFGMTQRHRGRFPSPRLCLVFRGGRPMRPDCIFALLITLAACTRRHSSSDDDRLTEAAAT